MARESTIIRLAVAFMMIAIGGYIYILSRRNIIFFSYLPDWLIEKLRFAAVSDSITHGFVGYCLPDGLWYGALLISQDAFYDRTSAISRIVYAISIILPFVWEILQLRQDVVGTFDFMDMAAYAVTLMIFLGYKKFISHD